MPYYMIFRPHDAVCIPLHVHYVESHTWTCVIVLKTTIIKLFYQIVQAELVHNNSLLDILQGQWSRLVAMWWGVKTIDIATMWSMASTPFSLGGPPPPPPLNTHTLLPKEATVSLLYWHMHDRTWLKFLAKLLLAMLQHDLINMLHDGDEFDIKITCTCAWKHQGTSWCPVDRRSKSQQLDTRSALHCIHTP